MSQFLQKIAGIGGRSGWLTVNSFESSSEKRRAAIAASYTIADDGPTRTLVIYGLLMSFGRGANAQLSEREFKAIEGLVKSWHEPAAGATVVRQTFQPERIPSAFDANVGNKVRRAALMSTKPAVYVAYGAACVVGKGHALKERTRQISQSWWHTKEAAHFLYSLELNQAMEEAITRVSDIYSVKMPPQEHLVPKLDICGRLENYRQARDIVLRHHSDASSLFYSNI